MELEFKCASCGKEGFNVVCDECGKQYCGECFEKHKSVHPKA